MIRHGHGLKKVVLLFLAESKCGDAGDVLVTHATLGAL
jgi:hypothetical protein